MDLLKLEAGRRWIAVAAMASFTTLLAPVGFADDAKKIEFFESRIRPVLVMHCYECHSQKSDELGGGLLLENAAAFRAGGESGPSIVAGHPEKSLVISALKYDELEMPPDSRLSKKVIADFERWIQDGAVDPRKGDSLKKPLNTIDLAKGREFWAFRPLSDAPTPKVENTEWPRTQIDRFILAGIEAKQLEPVRDASRRTLVRRLYFDLIGLPPTPEQVDAFLAADEPAAVESLVDKLLASKQFGVHWGRHWLDVARYADSNGGDFNATFHDAWRYRDYVIDAFNDDKPFNQFVREQLAGDLLEAVDERQRSEQLVATGFLMVGTKMLSERDKTKLRMDVVDEQITAVGSAFLGMTLGCVRCHEHKFDPIPLEDYYALAGIFRSTVTLQGESQQYVSTWKTRSLPAPPEQVAAVRKHAEDVKAAKKSLAEATKRHTETLQRIVDLQAGSTATTVDNVAARITGAWKDSTYSQKYVGAGYIHDDKSGKGDKSVEFKIKPVMTALHEVRISYTSGSTRAKNVPITVRTKGQEKTFTLDQTPTPPINGLFAAVGRLPCTAGEELTVTISNRGTEGYVIVDAVQIVPVDDQGSPIQDKSSIDQKQLEAAEIAKEKAAAPVAAIKTEIKRLESNAPSRLPSAFAVADAEKISDCEICIRGQHANHGPLVERGFLQVASTVGAAKISTEQSGRRELADWIVDPKTPLTARVYVNRVWSHLIGQGIVRSVDNFGTLGDPPSHPLLLDQLAREFINEGWSTKKLIHKIVLSRVYQLSSRANPSTQEVDPENRLLTSAHRRYVTAEGLRDSLLAISGQLDLSAGASPVEGLGVLVTTNSSNAKGYERKQSTKRSVYLPIIRNELPPILKVFDFADPDMVIGKRPVTNVPAQALLMMNSPFVMDCAERTAERIRGEGPLEDRTLVERASGLVLSRPPSPTELKRSIAFLEKARQSPANQQNKLDASTRALAQLIHVYFASTEFRLLD